MTTAPNSVDLRTIALGARLAPSVHNTQPWRFEIAPGSFTLMADRRRQLHVLDPTGRQLMISLGCALFNARVAAAAAGLAVVVTRFSDGGSADAVARLDVAPGTADVELAAHESVLRARSTNRRRFADEPVPPDLLATLHRVAAAENATLVQIRDEADRITVANLSQQADTIQYQDRAYRAELRAWTTNDQTRLDGVAARTVPHVDAGSGDEVPIRDFDSAGAGWLPTDTASTRNQCLLLLGTDEDDPWSWLRAGEALERVLLEIAGHGFAASPLTQIVEVPAIRIDLRNQLRLSMYPHILLRVGRAAPTPASSRRHLDELVTMRPSFPS